MPSRIDHGTTRDGLIQMRRRWQPRGPARAAILLLHGMGEHTGRYEHVGDRLAEAGFDVVGIDHRGFGRSGGRRGHVDSWSQFSDDVEDQLAEVRTLGLPTIVLAHSMGGLIAIAHLIDGRPPPDLLVLSGPLLGTDIPRHLRTAAPVLGRLLPTFEIKAEMDPAILSTDARVGEVFFADPLRVPYPTARMGAQMIRTIDEAREGIERVTIPTLVQHGGDDELVPTEVSEILESQPNVRRIVYPGLRHEIYNEPEGAEVLDDAISWLDEQLAALAS